MRRGWLWRISLGGILIQMMICAPARAGDSSATTTVRVAGVVRDALGRPIKDAALTIRRAGGHPFAQASSNAAGEFSFDTIPRGNYAVVAKKSGFRTATAVVKVTAKSPAPLAIAMEAESAISLPVVAKRVAPARNAPSPETGGSVYRFTQQTIQQMPQGNNSALNQVLLQAPGVAQDSYGQLHVRGDHADLQYRINGVQLPEGVTGFGQVLSPRFAQSVNLMTGALPAQFGLRTAGIVDIKTKNGTADNTASLDFYGGQRGTIQPSFEYGGSSGNFSYFATGQYLTDNRGLEPPTPGPSAIHDRTQQGQGFGYFSYVLNSTTRLSLITGAAANHFQIPDSPGQPQVFTLAGVPFYPSANVDENQFEQNYFGVIALQGTVGSKFDYQVAPFSRYSNVSFNPDHAGDLIFNGAAAKVFRSDWGNGVQVDTAYRGFDKHTLRVGGFFEGERAEIDDHESVFPANPDGSQAGITPFGIVANTALTAWNYSGYLQDEWKPVEQLTINTGVRFDLYDGLVRADQASPRISIVYSPFKGTSLHVGYARYFTPPPTELVSVNAIKQFAGTTGAAASGGNGNPTVERDHYFDAGVTQQIVPGLTVGVDSYYKKARDLLDEGQFGPALIFQTFNYAKGRVYGVEFTSSYSHRDLNSYANFAYGVAQGTQIESGQFNFAKSELQYINSHYAFLDHDQTFSSSAGAAYTWNGFTFSIDGIYGSGLRRGFANTGNLPYYIQVDAGLTRRIELARGGALEVRG
ncbi:MAG TPA: TonB-dependent receptor, partial [Candidatus Acidoferrales bacterium]|nr:TonB-dependent receptor [Candidatus Acidoferrales bacterium]